MAEVGNTLNHQNFLTYVGKLIAEKLTALAQTSLHPFSGLDWMEGSVKKNDPAASAWGMVQENLNTPKGSRRVKEVI